MSDIKIKVSEIEYHRNGISGEGFYAVRFTSRVCDESLDFLATVFDRPGCVSVICLDYIADHGVGVGNKWRGDEFAPAIRKAIKAREKKALA
jgi:hypothetical protein